MRPDPTPVSGMMPCEVSTLPLTVMRTTAGLALAATSIVADDSSMVTGWLVAPTVVPVGEVAVAATGFSSAPEAVSAATVPPDARTAARSAAPRTVPTPRPDRELDTELWVTGVAGTVPAGSYHRSGVGDVDGAASWRVQSGRASAGGGGELSGSGE